jgi:sulfide dehydrogenase cytochrome subunit
MVGRAAIAAVLAIASMGGALAADADGAVLALSCSGCHGIDAASDTGIPPLAGMDAAEIEAALVAFRSGERTGTIMNRFARGYSDEEIKALAAHFSEVKP